VVFRETGLGAVIILGGGDGRPADRGGVVKLVKAVGAFQIVVGVLEAQLDQVPPRRIGPAEKVDGILRHLEIIKQVILTAVVIGRVHPADTGSAIQIGTDLRSPVPVHGRRVFVKENPAIAFRHWPIGRVHLAGGEGIEPRPAQVIGPGLFRGHHLPPETVEVHEASAEGRQAGGDLGPARGAEGDSRVAVGETHAPAHQPVKVRGPDRDAERIPPGEDIDHVIDPDDADIVAPDAVGAEAHPPVTFSRAGSAQRCRVWSSGPGLAQASRRAPRFAGQGPDHGAVPAA